MHPWCQQREIKSYCDQHKIVVQAYCPLRRAGDSFKHPTIVSISKETGKSPAQVLIRWSLQSGFVPLPKSDHESRIKENVDVFDFCLGEEQMNELDALDQGAAGAIEWNPVDCD